MSQVEIISTSSSVDLGVTNREPSGHSDGLSWTTNILVDNLSSSPTLRLTASQPRGANINIDENIFPSLPPLLHGHPSIHLRNGVMNASRAAANRDPDAERAFFVADLGQVYAQHLRWQACLPDILPFYAVKCNPDPYVLRLLAALGTGFDCASNGEISQILDIGVDPSRIIYANPCKAVSFVRNAGKLGVDMMTFDNIDELYKISRAHPRAQLVVRILADDSKSLCAFNTKFGASLVAVPGLLRKAKELNLNVVGVSFHVGSGCYDPSVYTDAVMRAKTAFDMGTEAGYHFSVLDVGGGFEDASFEQAATFLTDAITTYFPDRHGIKIIAEPGRFYVSKAFSLATNIIARRAPVTEAPVNDEHSGRPAVMYYINDGVYGAFNCILFDHQTVHPYVLSIGGSFHVAASEPVTNSSVWGPTCDSIDCVCPTTQLPGALRVGDWLAFDNMGAYTVCAASQFNGFEVSKVIYTTGGFAASEVRGVLAKFVEDGHNC
ncbi:Ornithine decarboxylase [Mycena sanguinolenta]|uniref:ornithine decarboxylase n=1 Tax=Mycena sanguinolenta TaxID=230812 RepID=A0A8H7DJJ2_9AGAR|nr:Ornithine decarboxylase [Mycena sanguinolenta]